MLKPNLEEHLCSPGREKQLSELLKFFCLFVFSFFFFGSVACGILVPQPGMELVPPAVEAQS